jgi:hypothetical protein
MLFLLAIIHYNLYQHQAPSPIFEPKINLGDGFIATVS